MPLYLACTTWWASNSLSSYAPDFSHQNRAPRCELLQWPQRKYLLQIFHKVSVYTGLAALFSLDHWTTPEIRAKGISLIWKGIAQLLRSRRGLPGWRPGLETIHLHYKWFTQRSKVNTADQQAWATTRCRGASSSHEIRMIAIPPGIPPFDSLAQSPNVRGTALTHAADVIYPTLSWINTWRLRPRAIGSQIVTCDFFQRKRPADKCSPVYLVWTISLKAQTIFHRLQIDQKPCTNFTEKPAWQGLAIHFVSLRSREPNQKKRFRVQVTLQ